MIVLQVLGVLIFGVLLLSWSVAMTQLVVMFWKDVYEEFREWRSHGSE